MEITEWTMYWFTRLDAIDKLFYILVLISAMCVAAAVIGKFACYVDKDEEASAKITCPLVLACVLLALSVLGSCLIPTSKEYAVIKIVPALYNNETIRDDARLLHDAAVEYLKELLPAKDGKEE